MKRFTLWLIESLRNSRNSGNRHAGFAMATAPHSARKLHIMSAMHRVSLGLLVALMSCAAVPAQACTIPVFRYALERWTPSLYDIVIFRHGDFSREQLTMLESIGRRQANAEIRSVDLAGKVDDEDMELWKAQEKTGDLPWVVARFPGSDAKSPVAWSGTLSREGLLSSLESPARAELSKRLMAGDSCVWVVLGSANKENDDRTAKTLATELKRLETTLTLPEIAPDGPQIKSTIPLKLKFSILRVSRDDPREAALVQMLRVAEPQLFKSEEALVIPVIGRGRAVSALPASKVDGERIGAFAEFVSGQCSCEVKDLNPGIDLLMTANWDLIFEDGQNPIADEPPREVGGKIVPIAPAIAVATTRPVVAAVATVQNSPAAQTTGWRKYVIAGIALMAVVAVISGIAALRGRKA